MKINKALLKRYKNIAKKWNSDEYAGIRRDDKIPDLIKLMKLENLHPNSKILDAMCGTGLVGKAIEAELEKIGRPGKVFFLDFSRDMLAQINSVSDKITEADIRSIPYPGNFFDRIILRGSLHDLGKDFQQEAIKEIFRILKRGGIFILSCYCSSEDTQFYYNLVVNYKDELSGHNSGFERYFPTKKGYEELLKEAGFSKIRTALEYSTTITYQAGSELNQEAYDKWKFLVLNFPKHIRTQMNIQEKNDGFVSYDFPVTVFAGKKK